MCAKYLSGAVTTQLQILYFLDQMPPLNSSPMLPDLGCYSCRPQIVAALQLEHTDHTHLLLASYKGGGGGHSHRPCTSTRDWGQNVGQVAKVENLSSQRVQANFSWSKWSKLVQRSTLDGCGLISFEVGQGSRPTFRCGQEIKA